MNAPQELQKVQDQFWAHVDPRAVEDAVDALHRAADLIEQVAYIERVARRMRRKGTASPLN